MIAEPLRQARHRISSPRGSRRAARRGEDPRAPRLPVVSGMYPRVTRFVRLEAIYKSIQRLKGSPLRPVARAARGCRRRCPKDCARRARMSAPRRDGAALRASTERRRAA